MRLNKKNKGRMAGPISCLGLLGLAAIGLICPQFQSTFAAEQIDCNSVFGGVQTSRIIEDENGNAGLGIQTREGVTADQVQTCFEQTIGVSFMVLSASEPSTPAGGVGNVNVNFIVQKAADPQETDKPLTVTFVVVGTHQDLEKAATITVKFNVEEFLELISSDATKTDWSTANGYVDRKTMAECEGMADGAEKDACIAEANGFDFGMKVDPTVDGALTSDMVEFKVRGNNRGGFGVYIYSEGSTALINQVGGVDNYIIPTMRTTAAYDSIPVNTWGYNVYKKTSLTVPAVSELGNFQGLQHSVNLTPAISSPTANDGIEFAITTAAKINTNVPAGEYGTNMMVSAVAPYNASLLEQGPNQDKYAQLEYARSVLQNAGN